jgi:hypothetical protein
MLVARAIVDIDCDAAQGRDFGGEFVEPRIVLSSPHVSVPDLGAVR